MNIRCMLTNVTMALKLFDRDTKHGRSTVVILYLC